MFITFEGPEGSGKSTQIARAGKYLAGKGWEVVVTREPGGTAIADQIRAILLQAENQTMTPTTELLLYFAARAQHVEEKLRPALKQGKIVLCDRFADSTWAYQGYARGLGTDLVEEMNKLATGGLQPDLTLLLDLPVEIGLQRAGGRADRLAEEQREDRFEREDIEFHRRLREGFLLLAKKNPKRFRVVDASGGVEDVWRQIQAVLDADVIGESK